jgi:hypothetical protein
MGLEIVFLIVTDYFIKDLHEYNGMSDACSLEFSWYISLGENSRPRGIFSS